MVVGHELSFFHGKWDCLRPGMELVSPALAGDALPLSHQGSPEHEVLTTGWPGKSYALGKY